MNRIKSALTSLPPYLLSGLTAAAILWLTLAPDPLGDHAPRLFEGADKVAHALMFGGLTVTLLLDRQRRGGWGKVRPSLAWTFAVAASLLGIVIEFVQLFMAVGRGFETADMVADATGAFGCAALWLMLQGRWSQGDAAPEPEPRRHLIKPRWLRITLKTLMWIVIAVLLVPVLLYIPPVQTLVKNIACSQVLKSTGMQVAIGEFRLKFPLDVSLRDLTVVEASGDTMVSAREAIADVKLLPLLRMDVQINELLLKDGYYRMVSPDSSMIMEVRAHLLRVDDGSSADMSAGNIVLNDALLQGGDVSLYMDVWRQKATPKDTAQPAMCIEARRLRAKDLTFAMSMLPTIDTLRLHTASLNLDNGVMDLGKNLITAKSLTASDGSVTYLTPTPEWVKEHPAPAPVDTVPSAPMVIRADSVGLYRFDALYAVKGAEPLPGFDPSYIQASDLDITLKGFANSGQDITLPIAAVSARERSGLQICSGHGTIAVGPEGIDLDGVELNTVWSSLHADASIPFSLMEMQPDAKIDIKAGGSLGWPDIEAFMPDMAVYTRKLPQRVPLQLGINASGTLGDVDIPELNVSADGIFLLAARGHARNAMDLKRLTGALDLEGSVTNPGVVDNLLGNVGFKMPSLRVKGHATAASETYAVDFKLLTSAGDVTADGRVAMTSENYRADVTLREVNVAHFAPTLGVGRVSAALTAKGRGFDPTLPHAQTQLRLDVASLVYGRKTLRDIVADVTLADGAFTVTAVSDNPSARLRVDGSGTVAPGVYTFDVNGSLANLDLQALGLSDVPNGGSADLCIAGTANPDKWLYDIALRLSDLKWTAGNQYFAFPQPVTASLRSRTEGVDARIDSRLTSLAFSSPDGLKALVERFALVADTAARQIERRDLNVEWLQATMPRFTLGLNVSGRGDVGRYLNTMGLSLDTVSGRLANDSLLHGGVRVLGLGNRSMTADTLDLGLNQRGQYLDYRLHMGNRPGGALAEFADVTLRGYAGSNRLMLSLMQRNQKRETGYRLGMTAYVTDSAASVHFTPLNATIAYMPWSFNEDNHVDYSFATHHIDANLMAASRESSIKLLTEPGYKGNDQLNVAISNLKIQDFLRMSVFAPPVTATVNSDLKLGYAEDWLYGAGDLDVTDFTYDKMRVGDFGLNLMAGLNNDGSAGARVGLKIDGSPAMAARVSLRPDSVTKELTPDTVRLELTRFPLHIANAFVGNDVARLSGYLNGGMQMKGTLSAPLLTGSIACDSVGVFIPMIGSRLSLNEDSVKVSDNVLSLEQFDIWGSNSNPLVIDGTVDMSRLSAVKFDLAVSGRNVQLVGSRKKSGTDLYGKLFADMEGSVRGPMEHINVNADIKILNTTDLTYVVPATTSQQLTQKDAGDVVKFVNFNDTTGTAPADTVAPAMAMRLMAKLGIEPGTQVRVEIPGGATGGGKVQIAPSGQLSYFQNYMGDMRLNGQLFTGKGFVKYSLPLVSVDFDFNPESYVLWNGDLMNPTLNIEATETKRANLMQDGNTRLVTFDVGLDITNTLSQPKVLFDLSTGDDMTIQNDLLSMSADQRSMAAINLLVTGQYNSQGVRTASSDLLQSTAYGLLTSQLNGWLGNHVKGVDLSFGVNQYETATDGQSGSTTSYSYQMSKSLFNNKFKISVGGNYTTDASADENFSENLISDISFEYMLRQTSNVTMYARIFRHTGYESILEGEITEMGGGFVLKRRLADLRELFKLGNPFRRRETPGRRETAVPPASAPDSTENTTTRTSHEK